MPQPTVARGMRTFVIIWIGQLVSILGSSLSSFALGVWVYQRSGSVTQFALVSFFFALPGLLVAPLAGAIVDRADRRRIMILSDTGSALLTLLIALLLLAGRLEVWHIYLTTIAASIILAFQGPAHAASTPLIVPEEQLGRANGMAQIGGAASQIAAPVLAGALLALIGIQGVFVIDFATFLFAVTTLLLVRIPQPPASADTTGARGSLLREAAYGWTYLAARPGLLGLLLLFASANFLLSTVVVLVTPLILSVSSPVILGTVLSVGGVGMLLGSIAMSVWGGPKRRVYGVLGFMFLGGLFIALSGVRAWVPLFIATAFGFLFTLPIANGCTMSIWQTKVAPDVQGRVFAVSDMVGGFTRPISFLIAGPLADRVFEPLLAPGGALAGSIGRLIGVGAGRGIGLLFIVMGTLLMLVSAAGYLYPRIKLLDTELPNMLPVASTDEQPGGVVSAPSM